MRVSERLAEAPSPSRHIEAPCRAAAIRCANESRPTPAALLRESANLRQAMRGSD
jgi:hypothetical protein